MGYLVDWRAAADHTSVQEECIPWVVACLNWEGEQVEIKMERKITAKKQKLQQICLIILSTSCEKWSLCPLQKAHIVLKKSENECILQWSP